MSKKSNPTLIGAFVVGAVALLATGVALFGGAELFAKRDAYVAYFVENTQGLRTGSTVMLNGVAIGHVSSVALLLDADSYEAKTEVIIEILPDSYIVISDGNPVGSGLSARDEIEKVISAAGLRAVLQVESFVTGQLLIEFDFRPDTEPVMRGGDDPPYPEIPTIPSRTQELMANVQSFIADLGEGFDFDELGEHVENILEGVDELANSEDIRESLAGLNSIINQEDTQALTATLRTTLDKLSTAAADTSSLLQSADGAVDALQPAIDKLVVALDEASAALAAARIALQGDSSEAYQLSTTLHEVESAARALREFLDYLEKNPEALLRGKK